MERAKRKEAAPDVVLVAVVVEADIQALVAVIVDSQAGVMAEVRRLLLPTARLKACCVVSNVEVVAGEVVMKDRGTKQRLTCGGLCPPGPG